MVIRIVQTQYINAQTNYLTISLGHAAHTHKTRSRLSPTVFVAVEMNRSLLRLNSKKSLTVRKMFRTLQLSVSSFVELSRVGRCDQGFILNPVMHWTNFIGRFCQKSWQTTSKHLSADFVTVDKKVGHI